VVISISSSLPVFIDDDTIQLSDVIVIFLGCLWNPTKKHKTLCGKTTMCVHYVICSQAGNIPAKFLDHLLGVSRDFTRELNGIDSTNYQRVGLHWITA